MRSATAALTVFSAQFSGQVLAHPGADVHVHGLGVEHALLFVVIAGMLAFAARK